MENDALRRMVSQCSRSGIALTSSAKITFGTIPTDTFMKAAEDLPADFALLEQIDPQFNAIWVNQGDMKILILHHENRIRIEEYRNPDQFYAALQSYQLEED